MTSLVAHEVLIAAVVVERGVELVVSRRHERALFARGAVEHGAGHYGVLVVLHVALLAGCVLEPLLLRRPLVLSLSAWMLAIVLFAQGLRWWAIKTLGVHWTKHVIVLPGAPRIGGGPYRWFRHPNYAAVIAEGIALPLVHSAWLTAMVFTVANAFLLRIRIRTEDAALETMRAP